VPNQHSIILLINAARVYPHKRGDVSLSVEFNFTVPHRRATGLFKDYRASVLQDHAAVGRIYSQTLNEFRPITGYAVFPEN
jgi:hypothetical protein